MLVSSDDQSIKMKKNTSGKTDIRHFFYAKNQESKSPMEEEDVSCSTEADHDASMTACRFPSSGSRPPDSGPPVTGLRHQPGCLPPDTVHLPPVTVCLPPPATGRDPPAVTSRLPSDTSRRDPPAANYKII